MIVQRCISIDTPEEWRQALEGIQHAFAHTWESCYAMQLSTGLKTYLYCFESEDARVVCPIAERTFSGSTDIVTPYGFSGFVGNRDCVEFPYYWSEFVTQKGYVCGYFGLHPLFENSTYFDAATVYQSNSLYFLDLTLTSENLFANLDRNRKRQLGDWEHIKADFIFEREALTKFFLANYHDFIEGVNASPANYFSRETLEFLCGLDNVFIVGRGSGKIEAVYLFAYTPYVGDCLFNIALSQGRQLATTLLWSGLDYLKSIRVPILNLGGGVRGDDSIAESKRRFGSLRLPFRCLKQVYDPPIFKELCQRVNADPNDRAGYFPPYARPSSIL